VAANEAERIEHLTRALDLFRGRLLPGHYEEWILPEQQRLDELFLQVLGQLTTHFERAGDFSRALQYARRAVSADPLREEAQHELIRLLDAAGQPGAALRQYRELERLLKRELGAIPGAATRALVDGLQRSDTAGPEWTASSEDEVRRSLPAGHQAVNPLEPVGGAVPLGSPFYVVRSTDEQFAAAIARQDSIVLVKGPRQVGKTSLLVRGLEHARQQGARVALTDFELFNATHLVSAEALVLAMAQSIADWLDLEIAPTAVWSADRGPNPNFRRYMRREVLGKIDGPIVWGLDEVDRLFACDFGGEIFGLFRVWHNERALDPDGPWSRLTLAIAYATEAHLFITDLHKSPFNVGTRLELHDFSPEQVADLNRRYGSPLKSEAEEARFYQLVSGHPYLVRRALHEMATQGIDITRFEALASRHEWVLGDYLQRLLLGLTRDPDLCEVVRGLLKGRPCPTPESFYRLRTAGVIIGDSEEDARLRCQLLAAYLGRYLL
jgi:hypothetical protein